jgi:hypothetical protein
MSPFVHFLVAGAAGVTRGRAFRGRGWYGSGGGDQRPFGGKILNCLERVVRCFTGVVADEAVALVAGATRGAGRAIAVELARAGFFVCATGRSSRATGPSEIGRPETIEETGELILAAGGAGRARRGWVITRTLVRWPRWWRPSSTSGGVSMCW